MSVDSHFQNQPVSDLTIPAEDFLSDGMDRAVETVSDLRLCWKSLLLRHPVEKCRAHFFALLDGFDISEMMSDQQVFDLLQC